MIFRIALYCSVLWGCLGSGFLLFAAQESGAEETSRFVDIPVLPPSIIELRTVYLENDQVPGLSPAELSRLLRVTEKAADEYLGIKIRFRPPDKRSIDDLFMQLDQNLESEVKNQIADFKTDKVDWSRLQESIRRTFRQSPSSIDDLWDYAKKRAAIPFSGPKTEENLSRLLAETMKTRLTYWTEQSEINRPPYIDGHPYNEWVYWDMLPRIDFPWEVAITNQPVISAEYYSVPIHSTLRGGITGGSTTGNQLGKYGSMSWLSVFPFVINDKMIIELRNGDTYSRKEALELAGMYLTHELGHQLFHLGHPWGNPACIMRPAELLDFRAWKSELSATKCKLGSSVAMSIGAVKIPKSIPFDK